jgi:hypothetical protein
MEIIDITPISLDENPVNAYFIEEAATRLRMSVKSVRRQITRGNLRRCGKFGRILIPRKDVDTYFERTATYA